MKKSTLTPSKGGTPYPASFPYLMDPRFELWAVGGWKTGGFIQFYFAGKLLDTVNLPPAKWGLIALLVDSSLRSAGNWLKAFRSARELSRDLHKLAGRGNSDPANLIGFIHKLRSALGTSIVRKKIGGRALSRLQFGKMLVEHHSFLGYRISLPPENLRLELLDDASQDLEG